MSMTHRTFSNLLSGLRISLLFLISEFFSLDEKKSELKKKKEKKEVFEICDSSYLEIHLDWFLSRSVPENLKMPLEKGKVRYSRN